ncbi:Protein of unknown function [Gryllus bimaculatus]|nr:Protein of unknown function [Gryllus bimaculatus]
MLESRPHTTQKPSLSVGPTVRGGVNYIPKRGFSFQSDARAQMKFRALCALALAAWACVARERARRRPDGARELLAVPDGDPAAETAPRAPEQCRSGMGHALRLLRHLPRLHP